MGPLFGRKCGAEHVRTFLIPGLCLTLRHDSNEIVIDATTNVCAKLINCYVQFLRDGDKLIYVGAKLKHSYSLSIVAEIGKGE